jgi:hypothetical protein
LEEDWHDKGIKTILISFADVLIKLRRCKLENHKMGL